MAAAADGHAHRPIWSTPDRTGAASSTAISPGLFSALPVARAGRPPAQAVGGGSCAGAELYAQRGIGGGTHGCAEKPSWSSGATAGCCTRCRGRGGAPHNLSHRSSSAAAAVTPARAVRHTPHRPSMVCLLPYGGTLASRKLAPFARVRAVSKLGDGGISSALIRHHRSCFCIT